MCAEVTEWLKVFMPLFITAITLISGYCFGHSYQKKKERTEKRVRLLSKMEQLDMLYIKRLVNPRKENDLLLTAEIMSGFSSLESLMVAIYEIDIETKTELNQIMSDITFLMSRDYTAVEEEKLGKTIGESRKYLIDAIQNWIIK